MSDDLRIYGRSAGFGGGGRKPGAGLERFKRGRKPGDVVRGVFLSLEPGSPGTAWVNLEGERLLAQLPPEWAELARAIAAASGVGAGPGGPQEGDFPLRQGDTCYFVLESLEPEPHLRMLRLDSGGSPVMGGGPGGASGESLEAALAREQAKALWRGLSALPPAQLASRYAGLRSRLDSMLEGLWEAPGSSAGPLNPAAPQAAVNRARYCSFLAGNPKAAEAYAELSLYRAAFLLALKPYGLLGFNYLPWLFPAARAVELARVYRPRELFVLQATLPDGRRFEISGKCPLAGGLPPGGPDLHEVLIRPGQPDLLGGLLALYPESVRSGFSLRT